MSYIILSVQSYYLWTLYWVNFIFESNSDHQHFDQRKLVKVLYDYEPEDDDELKIEAGDYVEVIANVIKLLITKLNT